MLKILTWNVNSLRSRVINVVNLAKSVKPDVMLLQEIKCTKEQFPFFELDCLNYNIKIAGQKGRNGVAILSKFPLYDVEYRLPLYNIVENDEEARYLEARIDFDGKAIKIASIYVPNGGPSVIDVNNLVKDVTTTGNFANKMRFFDRLRKKFVEDVRNGEVAIFGADYNVCPNLYKDVYSPMKDGTITNTKQERDKFAELLKTGVSDIWRDMNPETREFSWWGYRPMTMYEKNQGYRLDALLVTPSAKDLIKKCEILRYVRGEDRPSDHVPMICEVGASDS
jgi:exodeoxyribonuclease-3